MGLDFETQRLPGYLIGINKLALAVGRLSMDDEPKAPTITPENTPKYGHLTWNIYLMYRYINTLID